MTLDLDSLTRNWDVTVGPTSARWVMGRDGKTFIQFRVDLGLLQMFPDGRPDGNRYHGLPNALAYVEHELRVAPEGLAHEHWAELERELSQFNYRRLALSSLADDALRDADDQTAEAALRRVIRDIDTCERILKLQRQAEVPSPQAQLRMTLAFNRARLLCQLRILRCDFDGAIEAVENGAERLEALLQQEIPEYDDVYAEQLGVNYLWEMGRQLRLQYNLPQTLREQLESAIADEQYEEAAELHQRVNAHAELQLRHERAPMDHDEEPVSVWTPTLAQTPWQNPA